MDSLPSELSSHILALLDYRHLASAAKVCRTWNRLSSQAELWKTLYIQRWGQDKASRVILSNSVKGESWKTAYEVEDRCDRIGSLKKDDGGSAQQPTYRGCGGTAFVREGDYYFLAKKGHLLRFLGSRNGASVNGKQSSSSRHLEGNHSAKTSTECPRTSATSEMEVKTSRAGLLDKLIQFVADLGSEHHRITKRARAI